MKIRFFQSLLLLSMTLIFISPAFAEDEKEKAGEQLNAIVKEESGDKSVHYSPDFCDFEITFPDAPYTSKRCPQGTGKCYNLTGYTMVYDLTTTVEVSVTCVPSTPANYERYNERVIKAALNGMVERAGIDDYSINSQEIEGVRQGSLIGTGKYGKQGRIYNAQLWIGQNSVFTVEAKLTGQTHGQADAVFSDILSSIKKKPKNTVDKKDSED